MAARSGASSQQYFAIVVSRIGRYQDEYDTQRLLLGRLKFKSHDRTIRTGMQMKA
jgi:hypothetical protein